SLLHKGLEYWRGQAASRIATTKRGWSVVTQEYADHQIRCKAYEPSILLIVCRAGLASHRTIKALQYLRRTALNDAFHHRCDLIGGHRIKDSIAIVDQRRFLLIGPILRIAALTLTSVVLKYCLAVTILDTVDHRWRYAFATIRDDGIGRHHA